MSCFWCIDFYHIDFVCWHGSVCVFFCPPPPSLFLSFFTIFRFLLASDCTYILFRSPILCALRIVCIDWNAVIMCRINCSINLETKKICNTGHSNCICFEHTVFSLFFVFSFVFAGFFSSFSCFCEFLFPIGSYNICIAFLAYILAYGWYVPIGISNR